MKNAVQYWRASKNTSKIKFQTRVSPNAVNFIQTAHKPYVNRKYGEWPFPIIFNFIIIFRVLGSLKKCVDVLLSYLIFLGCRNSSLKCQMLVIRYLNIEKDIREYTLKEWTPKNYWFKWIPPLTEPPKWRHYWTMRCRSGN